LVNAVHGEADKLEHVLSEELESESTARSPCDARPAWRSDPQPGPRVAPAV
jgi:hypothetical protein